MKTKLILAVAATAMFFSSCDKKQETNPAATINPAPVDETKMTLSEFASTRWIDAEKAYFANTKVTDNTAAYAHSKNPKGVTIAGATAKPIIKFKWSGTSPTGHGCETPLGICIIIRASEATPNPASGLIACDVTISGEKFIIDFPKGVDSNFGLTVDGYMTFLYDLEIPFSTGKDLGLPKNTSIAAGIYKANIDPRTHEYVGIALDLKIPK